MIVRNRSILSLFVVLSLAAGSHAAPTLEESKAFSGLRFSEATGVPQSLREAPSVSAERGLSKALVTFSAAKKAPRGKVPQPKQGKVRLTDDTGIGMPAWQLAILGAVGTITDKVKNFFHGIPR